MKKQFAIILFAAALLSLAACSRGSSDASAPASAPVSTPSADEMALAAASDTDAAASVQSHIPPASSTDLQIDAAAFDKAIDCIGLTIFDLYGAIGQPVETPVYLPSAVQANAQDGTLVYKGFTVTTLRTDTQEIIHDVQLDLGDAATPQPTQEPAQDAQQASAQNAVG